MKNYLFLCLAIVSALCVLWALTIPDFGMVVLLACAVVYCLFAQFKLANK